MSLLQASEDEILKRKFSVLCRKAKKQRQISRHHDHLHHHSSSSGTNTQTDRQPSSQPANQGEMGRSEPVHNEERGVCEMP